MWPESDVKLGWRCGNLTDAVMGSMGSSGLRACLKANFTTGAVRGACDVVIESSETPRQWTAAPRFVHFLEAWKPCP